jgi:hypothetical protein
MVYGRGFGGEADSSPIRLSLRVRNDKQKAKATGKAFRDDDQKSNGGLAPLDTPLHGETVKDGPRRKVKTKYGGSSLRSE